VQASVRDNSAPEIEHTKATKGRRGQFSSGSIASTAEHQGSGDPLPHAPQCPEGPGRCLLRSAVSERLEEPGFAV